MLKSRFAPVASATTGQRLIVMLGLLTALDAMSIDMYLPAAPLLRQDFNTTDALVQDAMSAFLVGMVIGQLTWGPVSDQFGRRRPLLTGMVLFCVGSVLALVAPNVGTLIAGRFLQAVGASAGLVIARAVVHDLYDSAAAPKIYSLFMQILGLTALVSPLIGAAVLLSGNWRPIFALLLTIGIICTITCLIALPESLPEDRRMHTDTGQYLRDIYRLLGNRPYVCAAMASAFSMAGMFVLLTGSGFYFVQQAHWSSTSYASLYALTSLAFVITCQLNIRALTTMHPARIGAQALIGQLVLAVVLVALVVVDAANAWSIASLMTGLIAVLGFIIGNLTACAMSAAAEKAGVASGLLGVLQFMASALVAPWVTASGNTKLAMSLTLASCAAAAVLSWLAAGHSIEGSASR